MVAKTSEVKSVRVSSFIHMCINPPPTVELWAAVTNNRYWIAYVSGSPDNGWKLTDIHLAPDRRTMYSVLATTGHNHLGDMAFLGCTWIGKGSYSELTAEDSDGYDEFARSVLDSVCQSIHDAFCYTIKMFAQAEINPCIIPIMRMDK